MYTTENIQEYLKCRDSLEYFCKYIKLIDIDSYKSKEITLFENQKKILENYKNNKDMSVVDNRQTGVTTAMHICILHTLIFETYQNIALLNYKKMLSIITTDNIFKMYENLPDFLKQKILEIRRGFIQFENGNRLLCISNNENSYKGISLNKLFVDNADFIKDKDYLSMIKALTRCSIFKFSTH